MEARSGREGPARNLLRFGERAAREAAGRSRVALSVVTFQRRAGPNAFITAAEDAGLGTHVLAERGRFDTGPLRQLRAIVAEVRPDIVQSHNVKSHLFVRWLGLHRRFPWVAFNHGYTATDLKDRIYNQVDRWTLPSAHRVVAVCEPFARRLERHGVPRERIRIQHNSVPPFAPPSAEAVARVRQAMGNPAVRLILAVGRFSHEKGHSDLLRAASLLRRTGPHDWRIVLVGDGPESANLRSLTNSLGLENEVVFAGQQADVAPYYALAAILALPSHSEGSPNVVLEAMAAGVPVVATAVGGVPEILSHDQTGLITSPQDPQAMADGLRRLLDSESLRIRIGSAARERAATVYTPEAQCQAWVSIYEELLGGSASLVS
jgi:glycosyltransferase involved in cell wall biosynthesis